MFVRKVKWRLVEEIKITELLKLHNVVCRRVTKQENTMNRIP